MSSAAFRSNYAELLAAHQPKPIRTQKEYRRLLKVAESLTHPGLTREEGMLLDLIGGLIEQYETEHFPVPDATPAQVLEHLLEARGITAAEFSRQAQVSRQLVTGILNGRSRLTAEHIRRFADFFGVSPNVFVPRTSQRLQH
jgi:HTH-type transcriptional regulator/antitoxin HigA